MANRLYMTTLYLAKHNLLNKTYRTEAPCLAQAEETLKLAGAIVIREAFGTRSGSADILACFEGFFVAVECKSATGVLSEQQKQFIENVRAGGGVAIVARCMRDIIIELEKLVDRKKQMEG